MKRSRNIFLVGPMGAGKSTIGRFLAEELKMEFFDSDVEIEKRCCAEISWIFDIEGEDGFRQREEKVIHDLTEKQGIVLATGGGVVTSAINRTRLAGRGTVVYLKVKLAQQLDRTLKDKKRPLLQVGQSEKKDVLEKLNAEREPMYAEVADYIVETDERSVRTVAGDIIKMVTDAKL